MKPITIASIRALAEQLEADAAKVREILRQATEGEINPDQAAAALREQGIAII
jgi:plasmid stability protein